MKALCTQIAERKAWLIENHKCVAADFGPLTFFRENGELDEEKTLSAVNKYSKSRGFKESVEIRESVRRNNGSSRVVTESTTADLAKQVEVMKRSYGICAAETILTQEGCGEFFRQGINTEKEVRESWEPYKSILTQDELETLVSRRVFGPKKK
jgi:hypothetical protein